MGSTISVLSVDQRQASKQQGKKSLPTVRVVTRRRSSLERLLNLQNNNERREWRQEARSKRQASVSSRGSDVSDSRDTLDSNVVNQEHTLCNAHQADNQEACTSTISSPPSSPKRHHRSTRDKTASNFNYGESQRSSSTATTSYNTMRVETRQRADTVGSSSPRLSLNTARPRSLSTSSLHGSMNFYNQILSRHFRQMNLASNALSSCSSSPRSRSTSPGHISFADNSSGSSTPSAICVRRRDSHGDGNSSARASPSSPGIGDSPRHFRERGRWFGRLFNGRRHSTGNLQSVRIRSAGSSNTSGRPSGNDRTLQHHNNLQQRESTTRIIMLAESLFQMLDDLTSPSSHIQDDPSKSKTKPADESFVKKLPVREFTQVEQGEDDSMKQLHGIKDCPTCYVCLEGYVHGDQIRRLPCGHEFHMDCVDHWLITVHRVCPLCRQEVDKEACEEKTVTSENSSSINLEDPEEDVIEAEVPTE